MSHRITHSNQNELQEMAYNAMIGDDGSGDPGVKVLANNDDDFACCNSLRQKVAKGLMDTAQGGALPPVTGVFRRMYVAADMFFTYGTLAITITLNVFVIYALFSIPSHDDYIFFCTPSVSVHFK